MAGSMGHFSKPMSTREISAKAQDFDFNPFIPLKFWLRTADTLLREAHIYEHEANDQQAYLLLMRYAALVSEKLPIHPSAKDPEYRASMRAIQKTLPAVIGSLEFLKPRINSRYIAWEKALQRRKADGFALESGKSQSQLRHDPTAYDPAIAGNGTTLAAADNSKLAVELAHKEFRRRDAARKATRQAGVSEQEEQERRTAGVWDDWESAFSKNGPSRDNEQMRRDMEASRRATDGSHDIVPEGARKRPSNYYPPQRHSNIVTEYRYPTISKSHPLTYEDERASTSRSESPKLPYIPPKPPKIDAEYKVEPPPRPAKAKALYEEPETVPLAPPSSYTFRPSAYLENGKPLRTVFLPPTLRKEFLAHAESNTRRNLETCGMLCGTLIANALFIRRVVIPEQNSTSDTCETTNEGAFFDYCDKEDLMVLGWIHTHPTQTCFMSSRDLHTHAGYQVMMPESIAIVCAPSKNPSWGVFRLTDPPGMPAVLNCRQTGLFHPHPEVNIYTDALRPGHVMEAEGMEFDVVDLRPH